MKMLVSDYDETFYTSEKDVFENIRAANKFMNEGNLFVIATGRSISQIKREIDRLKIRHSYLICNDGALILNHCNDVLYRKDIEYKDVSSIVESINNNKRVDTWFIDTGSIRTTDPSNIANGIIVKTKHKRHAKKLLDEIEEKFSSIHGYIVEEYINITDKSVSKGNGIKIVNNMARLKSEDIYVIGDNVNDISMIEMFNGYVMKKASLSLREYKDRRCGSVRELIDIIKNKNEK